MKLAIALLLELAIAHASFAADFRSADFGMSPAQVRASEPSAEWMDSGDTLAFATTVGGLKAWAAYSFIAGKFFRGGYQIVTEHTNKTDYLDDYGALQSLLKEKYGAPKVDKTVWSGDLYKNDPARWGIAVATGQLKKLSQWQTDTTEIGLLIYGDNFEVHVVVRYLSRALKGQADLASHKDKLNGL